MASQTKQKKPTSTSTSRDRLKPPADGSYPESWSLATRIQTGLHRTDHGRKWDQRFLVLANLLRSWSKDPSTQVGSVIVRPDFTIASVGYNGFARGINDYPSRYNERSEKYPRIVHAELNAILNAREPLKECAIYVAPLSPCPMCANAIIQSGIKQVFTIDDSNERWGQSLEGKIAVQMFQEANIDMWVYPTEVLTAGRLIPEIGIRTAYNV